MVGNVNNVFVECHVRGARYAAPMRIILPAAFLLAACGPTNQAPQANVQETSEPRQSLNIDALGGGRLRLSARLADGADLSISCGEGAPHVYVDTRQDAASPPPLAGVMASFITDRDTFEAEMAWAASPRGAWSIRQDPVAAAVARSIIAASTVRFDPPKAFSLGEPLEWRIGLSDKDRARLAKACQSS